MSKCDLYVPGVKNAWVERGTSPNDEMAPGVCMLDSMTRMQVIYCIERDPIAREDLRRITTDPELLSLADEIPPLPTQEHEDIHQTYLNQPNNAGSIPFYAIFRGQPPFAQ